MSKVRSFRPVKRTFKPFEPKGPERPGPEVSGPECPLSSRHTRCKVKLAK